MMNVHLPMATQDWVALRTMFLDGNVPTVWKLPGKKNYFEVIFSSRPYQLAGDDQPLAIQRQAYLTEVYARLLSLVATRKVSDGWSGMSTVVHLHADDSFTDLSGLRSAMDAMASIRNLKSNGALFLDAIVSAIVTDVLPKNISMAYTQARTILSKGLSVNESLTMGDADDGALAELLSDIFFVEVQSNIRDVDLLVARKAFVRLLMRSSLMLRLSSVGLRVPYLNIVAGVALLSGLMMLKQQALESLGESATTDLGKLYSTYKTVL